MFEKIIIFILAILIAFGMASCSTLTRGSSDPTILEHQKRIAELEAANNDLANRLSKYDFAVTTSIDGLKAIGQRAQAAGSSVDLIISLFDQYQYEVERLIRSYQYAAGTGKGTQ